MAFGKKQPEMFEAFRRSKGDQPEDAKNPSQAKPAAAKPVELKPPVPMAGKAKVPTPPAKEMKGAETKAAQPKPQAPKPEQPTLMDISPVETKPAEVKPVEVKPITPTPVVAKPAVTPSAAPRLVTPVPTRPSASAPTSPNAASELGKLRRSDDVHVVTIGKKTEVIFGMSYHALITTILVTASVVLLIVIIAYAFRPSGAKSPRRSETPLGVVDGKAKGTETAPTPAPATGAAKGATTPAPATGGAKGSATTEMGSTAPAATDVFYRVQVLSVSNTPDRVKALDDDIKFLNEMRVENVVKQVSRKGDKVSLFAGAFTKDQKKEAEALAARMQLMLFHGRKEFKDAAVVQVK